MNYNIITTIDTGRLEVLSYSSEIKIKYGQLVSILVRNKPYMGICIAETEEESRGVSSEGKSFDIKPVEDVLPIILPKQTLDLIFKTHAFSWNRISGITSAVLQPFSFIEKQLKTIADSEYQGLINLNVNLTSLNNIDSADLSQIKDKPNNHLNLFNEHNTLLRIMYLIRNTIESFKKLISNDSSDIDQPNPQILIVFPDIATLQSYYINLEKTLITLSVELDFEIVLDTYFSENSIVKNRRTIRNLLSAKKVQIILSTRSGIFLSFKRLSRLILIEECNNNLIQEQNGLYFDSRDFSYILSQIWGCELDWVSFLPSSRTLAYNNNDLKQDESLKSNQNIGNPKIVIHEKNNFVDSNNLFSAATEAMIEEDLGPVLFIHPRRGNFRVTQCQQCRHVWYCPDCSAALVTYKNSYKTMELICHHCQNKFDYPNVCPECKGTEITSFSSGIEDLGEHLGNTYKDKEIYKIDTSNSKNIELFKQHLEQNSKSSSYYLTSKLYDPRVPYSLFKSIVFIQAQNLSSGIDYLTTEEIYYSLFNIYLQSQNIVNSVDINKSKSPTLLIFDTSTPELQLFQKLLFLNTIKLDFDHILALFKGFIIEELDSRKRFHLPPYHNLLLLTLSSKKLDTLKENMTVLYKWLKEATIGLQPELELTSPYPAKMLKRQGMFTYHLLLKYPKNFKHLKELDRILKPKITDMRLQARLNPRHIF